MSDQVEKKVAPQEEEQDLNELMQIRREKLARLQKAGKDPYEITTSSPNIHAADIVARGQGRVHRRPYYELARHGQGELH